MHACRAGVDTWAVSQTMSDCMYRWLDSLPGCPEPESSRLKHEYNVRAAEAQARPPAHLPACGL